MKSLEYSRLFLFPDIPPGQLVQTDAEDIRDADQGIDCLLYTSFARKNVPYVEVDILEDFDQVLRNVLSGPAVLFIDGYSECICIDCRTYPARGVDEPEDVYKRQA